MLEPLSKATGMPLHTKVGTKDSEALVLELKTEGHGQHPLIAWRHGDIPSLLTAFGAEAQLSSAKLIKEQLKVPASTP